MTWMAVVPLFTCTASPGLLQNSAPRVSPEMLEGHVDILSKWPQEGTVNHMGKCDRADPKGAR